jgi:putative transposase
MSSCFIRIANPSIRVRNCKFRTAKIFLKAGTENSHNKVYQFWRQDNQPKELITEGFARQKLDYIHNNPVEAGIVEKAEDYLYSSAMDYMTNKKGILEIKNLY